MEEGENIGYEELENLKEESLELGENVFEVNEGNCSNCDEKLVKVVENKSLLNGMLTFHIIKLRCLNCGKEYLDLEQAEKYDFFLLLERELKKKYALQTLSRKLQMSS